MHRLLPAHLVILLLIAAAASAAAAQTTSRIRLNQIGFYPSAQKVAAVIDAPAGPFYVTTPDGADTLFWGSLSGEKAWTEAGEAVRRADFSDLDATGEFVVAVPGLGTSYLFEIRPHVHQEVARAALKGYYFQRASTSLAPAYAGRWTRPAGHPDTIVAVHPSAATSGRPAGTIIATPKGWYDAGDYNKYVVNSGISVGTLLMLYEHYPEYFSALETNIPESGNGVPDLLDEVLWNMRWMLSMQDPDDGGVYHKTTTANFEGAVMPHQATQPRYVVKKSTPAALDFSAVMAIGSRIFADFEGELPGLADSMLTAAGAAWDWAQENPDERYDQNALNQQYDPNINTGEYGDGSFFDEFRWAAAELFVTMREDSFLVMYPPFQQGSLAAPSWPNVGTMAFYSLAHHRRDLAETIDTSEVKTRLLQLANGYVNLRRESPYEIVMGRSGDFFWGSNSLAANQGMALMQAYRLSGDERYLEAALSNLDYLLGRNATGYSFVTEFGDRTPMNPHHRQSQADGIRQPVPGLLVGGPNSGRQDNCTYPTTLPAKSYIDDWCSYASNEIAINWNAPFAYLAGAIEATLSPTGRPVYIETEGRVGIESPDGIRLENYPNPAAHDTLVRFSLARPAQVTLRAFDMLGREVSRALSGVRLTAGTHDARLDVSAWAPGVYFVRIEVDRLIVSTPLVVAR